MRLRFFFSATASLGLAAAAMGCGDMLGFDKLSFDDGSQGGIAGGASGGGGEGGTGTGGAAGEAGGGTAGGGTAGGGTAGGGTAGAGGAANGTLATGLTISGVYVYQGVSIPVMQNGNAIAPTNAPIVIGREALVRVFVTPTPDWQPRSVTMELDLSTASPITTTLTPSGASSEPDLGSTFNFDIPGAQIDGTTTFSVSVHENGGSGPGDSSGAQYPASGAVPLGAQDSRGTFKIHIVPFQYQPDGSNRLPDTSQAQLDIFHNRFLGSYPATDTVFTVHAPVGFSVPFSGNGAGWSELLNQTCALRQQEPHALNLYYYGILAPAPSFNQYCNGSCVAGLANLTTDPNDDYGRCSIGLGFSGEDSANTALQEVAHNLGRYHAPCGNPDGVDPGYPYGGASIGTWGWDQTTKQLQNPGTLVDFMSYCQPVWISDYTYKALFQRISYVNSIAKVITPPDMPTEWRTAMVDGGGQIKWGATVHLATMPGGEPRDVTVLDVNGNVVGKVTGHYYAYDSLPGGTLLVPQSKTPMYRAIQLPGSNPLPL